MDRITRGLFAFAFIAGVLYLPARWIEIQYNSGTWWTEHEFVTLGAMLFIVAVLLPTAAHLVMKAGTDSVPEDSS